MRVTPQTVFKTAGFNHSPIPPNPYGIVAERHVVAVGDDRFVTLAHRERDEVVSFALERRRNFCGNGCNHALQVQRIDRNLAGDGVANSVLRLGNRREPDDSAGLRVIAGAAWDIQPILPTVDRLEGAGFKNWGACLVRTFPAPQTLKVLTLNLIHGRSCFGLAAAPGIVRNAGIPFIGQPADIDETPLAGESPRIVPSGWRAKRRSASGATWPQDVVLGRYNCRCS